MQMNTENVWFAGAPKSKCLTQKQYIHRKIYIYTELKKETSVAMRLLWLNVALWLSEQRESVILSLVFSSIQLNCEKFLHVINLIATETTS